MRLYRKEESKLKRPFILAGIVTGAAVSGWYLYHNQARGEFPGTVTVPDPLWTQCVNVALIMFSAIYVLNLCRRIIEIFMKKMQS